MDAAGDKTVEIVLPSGAFARICHVSYRDFIEAMIGGDANILAVRFAARVVKLDGKPITAEEILDMDLDDATAVVGIANARLGRALATMNGVS